MSNAEKIIITHDSIDENYIHKYCSYVRAYFKHKGLKAGDYWIATDYMRWIGDKHLEFRTEVLKRTELGLFGYSTKEKEMFEDFIFNN